MRSHKKWRRPACSASRCPKKMAVRAATLMDAVLAIEQVAVFCPRSADVIQEGNFGAIRVLARFANADQKKRFLDPLLKGNEVIAVAMTEPDAGSATTDLATTAVPDGKGFRVTAQRSSRIRTLINISFTFVTVRALAASAL